MKHEQQMNKTNVNRTMKITMEMAMTNTSIKEHIKILKMKTNIKTENKNKRKLDNK